MIIDWNVALSVAELDQEHEPKGALCVQPPPVLTAMKPPIERVKYEKCYDLQSIVRAVYLIYHSTVLSQQAVG